MKRGYGLTEFGPFRPAMWYSVSQPSTAFHPLTSLLAPNHLYASPLPIPQGISTIQPNFYVAKQLLVLGPSWVASICWITFVTWIQKWYCFMVQYFT